METDERQKTIDSTPRSKAEIEAEIASRLAGKVEARSQRKAHFENVQPKFERCIVAWIDILGFREQLCNAETPEKIRAAYRRMRRVHEEFDKPSSSVDAGQEEVNLALGKRVIALSDGLVIAQSFEDAPEDYSLQNLYDRAGFFLAGLRLAQARCASMGNFVRGGVAIGYFWFEDDIMLSPALVSAYEIESKLAKNPVIVVHRDLVREVEPLKDAAGYAADYDPFAGLFRECEWMAEGNRQEHLMLNFMPDFLEDLPEPLLRSYYLKIVEARCAAPDVARSKYDFLIDYAQEFVRATVADLYEGIFAQPDGS